MPSIYAMQEDTNKDNIYIYIFGNWENKFKMNDKKKK
jgi:hypothetical protein